MNTGADFFREKTEGEQNRQEQTRREQNTQISLRIQPEQRRDSQTGQPIRDVIEEQIFQNEQLEQKRRRRVQRLKRERLQKCLIFALTSAAVLCMFLICSVSYSSIRAQANTGFKYYTSVTVESGETLWGISDRYIDYEHYEDKDAYIAEVTGINHLDPNGMLQAGQLLIVPYYSEEYIP